MAGGTAVGIALESVRQTPELEVRCMDMGVDILAGLSVAELEALADGLLAPAHQARLDELLSKNGETLAW